VLLLNSYEMPEDVTFYRVVPTKLVMLSHVDLMVKKKVIVNNLSQCLVSTSA